MTLNNLQGRGTHAKHGSAGRAVFQQPGGPPFGPARPPGPTDIGENMKKTLMLSICIAAFMFLSAGCESDGSSSSRCAQLVNFTKTCYEEIVGRSPSQGEIDGWSESCNSGAHTSSCINCAMEQTCDDYINRGDYVYNTLCAAYCP
jgi:hypothetical protein